MNIKAVLEVTKLTGFEAIVSAEDVERGKPDPQVFLAAAARLSVLPAHCVVVEDAPAGIEAARTRYVIHYDGTQSAQSAAPSL